jgi:hypothetical protein
MEMPLSYVNEFVYHPQKIRGLIQKFPFLDDGGPIGLILVVGATNDNPNLFRLFEGRDTESKYRDWTYNKDTKSYMATG